MAKKIVWSTNAVNHWTQIEEYGIQHFGSADRLLGQIAQLIESLKRFPESGRKSIIPGFRFLIISNYRIYYLIKPDMIVIAAIWDIRQNPDRLKL